MTSEDNTPDERRIFRELDGYLADTQHPGYHFDVDAGWNRLKSALNDRATKADTRQDVADPMTAAESAEPAAPRTLLETYSRVLANLGQLRPAAASEARAPQLTVLNSVLRRSSPQLVGRDTELRRILAAADAGARMVTIEGMPGAGKTALAIHAAHLLAERYPEGRYFVELHAHTPGRSAADSADVLADLLISVGVDLRHLPDTLQDRRDLWRDRLTGKRVLLVLDDVRDLDQIEPLLPVTPACLTLVTSRRRLFGLDDAVSLPLSVLEPAAAAEMFTTLAGRSATAGDRAAVARIVRMCGSLPLAIALLAGHAARHPSWSLGEIPDALAAAMDRLGELDAGDQAVRAAFDLSYRDLPAGHRLLFRRLGLHPGPDVDAHAAAALAGTDIATARRDLESLCGGHLLEQPTPGRYRLHDLLREYARTLAGTEPDPGRVQIQLLHYYQQTATTANRKLTRSALPDDVDTTETTAPDPGFENESQALEWLRLERDNLLACLDLAAERHRDWVVPLTNGLAGLLDNDGPPGLARQLHQRAIRVAQKLGDRQGEADAKHNLGAALRRAGSVDTATHRFEDALALYRVLADRRGEANVLNDLGEIHRERGEYGMAADWYRQALALYHELNDRFGEANAMTNLGTALNQTGHHLEAANLHRQALELYRQLDRRLDEENRGTPGRPERGWSLDR